MHTACKAYFKQFDTIYMGGQLDLEQANFNGYLFFK